MSKIILWIIILASWVAGLFLLFPVLHWKGMAGLFLVIFAYNLERNINKPRDSTEEVFRMLIKKVKKNNISRSIHELPE